MRMAHAADAACLLVGDIDRGGVFASLLGTIELLEPEDRARIRGFAINKFRGDESLLRPGVEMMEQRLGIPCAGVVPFLHDLGLEEEDSVAMEERRTAGRAWRGLLESDSPERPLRIGVVALPHMANFTDFDALAAEPSVSLAFLERADELPEADLLILPGSKQTLDDLAWLHRYGFVPHLKGHHARGAGIIGICGGFQMLGDRIDDPQGMESGGRPCSREGLGLLHVITVLHTEKITRRVSGRVRAAAFCGHVWRETGFRGYEIHVGGTVLCDGPAPFADITPAGASGASPDGAVSEDDLVFGTYVHGLFDDDPIRHAFLDAARVARGLSPARDHAFVAAEREARLDRLADHLRRSLNLGLIRSWIGLPGRRSDKSGSHSSG